MFDIRSVRRRATRPTGYPAVSLPHATSPGVDAPDALSPATLAMLRELLAHPPETRLEHERAAAEIMRLIRLDASCDAASCGATAQPEATW